MCDFKPGDEVVCVRDTSLETGERHAELVVGKTYTILSIEPNIWSDGRMDFDDPTVQIVEVTWPCPHHRGGYDPGYFRKVQKRKDSLTIESFLTIRPGFEEPRKAPVKSPEKREKV